MAGPLRAQTPTTDMYGPQVFRPSPENGCPPVLELFAEPVLGANERWVAMAAQADSFIVLAWLDGDGHCGDPRVGQRQRHHRRAAHAGRCDLRLRLRDAGRQAPGCACTRPS